MAIIKAFFLLALNLGFIYLFFKYSEKLSTSLFVLILFFVAAYFISTATDQIVSVWSDLFSGEEVVNFW